MRELLDLDEGTAMHFLAAEGYGVEDMAIMLGLSFKVVRYRAHRAKWWRAMPPVHVGFAGRKPIAGGVRL